MHVHIAPDTLEVEFLRRPEHASTLFNDRQRTRLLTRDWWSLRQAFGIMRITLEQKTPRSQYTR